MKDKTDRFLSLCIAILLLFSTYMCHAYISVKNKKPIVKTNKIYVETSRYVEKTDTLTEWQLMVMAIIGVESEYNKYADTGVYHGYFQMSNGYIKKANELTEEEISIANIHNFEKAIKAFNAMNDRYNPTHDIDKAIRLHNSKGGSAYVAKIKKRMEKIRKYEITRNEIVMTYKRLK